MIFVERSQRVLFIVICITGLFRIITFALVAATLGTINKRFDSMNSQATTSKSRLNSILAEMIGIEDLMSHLRQLQNIADESNGTREDSMKLSIILKNI
jgi:hypothetical protein